MALVSLFFREVNSILYSVTLKYELLISVGFVQIIWGV